MGTQIELRCRCGAVRGTVDDVERATVNHGTCYCTDCRAFALFLNRPDILNAKGGTDIVQTAPRRVRFTQVRISCAACVCLRQAIAALVQRVLQHADGQHDVGAHTVRGSATHESRRRDRAQRSTADELLGKPDSIYAREASGGPLAARNRPRRRGWLRAIALMLGWWISGLGKPSPYFDSGARERRVSAGGWTRRAEREQLRAPG